MTRIGIISDIHANSIALSAVLRDANRQNVKGFWMLGDAVGYGHDPLGVMETLTQLPIEPSMWLAGNHDWGVGSLEYPDKGIEVTSAWGDARPSIILHRDILHIVESTHHYIERLVNLPYYSQPRKNIFVAHGAYYPDSPEKGILQRYTNTTTHIEEDYEANQTLWNQPQKADSPAIVIYGHNHRPTFWQRRRDEVPNRDRADALWGQLPLPFAEPIPLDETTLYYLNPGSVGFPRNDQYPFPTYIILDEDSGHYTLQFRIVEYEVEKARRAMKRAGILPEVYDNRLLPRR